MLTTICRDPEFINITRHGSRYLHTLGSHMRIDINGKVKEKRLAFSHTLYPLFEAIVNSIHAIEDGSVTTPGIIKISLFRSTQTNINEDPFSQPITHFHIWDNGIGFTEANYDSFNFAHSTYKNTKGGKGIGRIIWLRAFEKVEIESIFFENNSLHHRRFNFELTRNGIEKHSLETTNGESQRFTEVRLKNLRPEYQRWCNSNAEDIALKIIEHCFAYFLRSDCPRILITDGSKEIVVNDYFKLYTKSKVVQQRFSIGDKHSFGVDLVKLYSPRIDNRIHYCAHTREVFSEKISASICELTDFLKDETGSNFSIAVYIFGKYFDDHVNEDRTQIHFRKEGEAPTLFDNDLSIEEIKDHLLAMIKSEYSDFLNNISEVRMARIRSFLQDHPRYRHLIKYKRDDVLKISSDLSDEKLEVELFKVQQKLELEVVSEAQNVIKAFDNPDNLAQFKEQNKEIYDKIIEVGGSKLSEYVIHRKLVLQLLEKLLNKSNEGKFQKEEVIHKLIFPLRKISDDVSFEEHNLWVIDERLAFHKYLASDIPLNKINELTSASLGRPDIIIFNKPFAFATDSKPYSSVVIIEFKKPMREDYTDDENPIVQINRYAREIMVSGKVDKDGRPMDIKKGTPLYAYIICDLTPKLRQLAEEQAYSELPDNDGYFNYNKNFNLHIEIISFDKLVRDSEQRNKALFDKLNILSTSIT